MTKKYYLVTDPCYIIDDNWEDFLEVSDYGTDFIEGQDTYPVKGGQIVACDTTAGGDGCVKIGSSIIAVDAGMVCIAEFDEKPLDIDFGYLTFDKEKAKKAFKKALTI